MKTRNGKGFTLVELLTTISVIGISASLLLPVLSKAKSRARDAQCLSSQKNYFIINDMSKTELHPDLNLNVPSRDYDNFYEQFKTALGNIVKDPMFGESGVYFSQNLTCPFSFNGKKRAYSTFITWNAAAYVNRSDSASNNGYVTANRFFDTDSDSNIIIQDQINSNFSISTTAGEVFRSLGEQGSQQLIFNNNILHPHKKTEGFYATFKDGSQKWVSQNQTYAPQLLHAP